MTWWRALSAVLSAFIGIRRGQAAAHDAGLRWWQVAIAIVVIVVGFIGTLLLLVFWVTSSSGQ